MRYFIAYFTDNEHVARSFGILDNLEIGLGQFQDRKTAQPSRDSWVVLQS